jgi:hypothetical protein
MSRCQMNEWMSFVVERCVVAGERAGFVKSGVSSRRQRQDGGRQPEFAVGPNYHRKESGGELCSSWNFEAIRAG